MKVLEAGAGSPDGRPEAYSDANPSGRFNKVLERPWKIDAGLEAGEIGRQSEQGSIKERLK